MKFHQDNGHYPKTLDNLIPNYLDSIPSLFFGYYNFRYYTGEFYGSEYASLTFAVQPPFGLLIYNLPEKKWTSLDLL